VARERGSVPPSTETVLTSVGAWQCRSHRRGRYAGPDPAVGGTQASYLRARASQSASLSERESDEVSSERLGVVHDVEVITEVLHHRPAE
jgi:hypothetical protein